MRLRLNWSTSCRFMRTLALPAPCTSGMASRLGPPLLPPPPPHLPKIEDWYTCTTQAYHALIACDRRVTRLLHGTSCRWDACNSMQDLNAADEAHKAQSAEGGTKKKKKAKGRKVCCGDVRCRSTSTNPPRIVAFGFAAAAAF
jgi:hypothetical protein